MDLAVRQDFVKRANTILIATSRRLSRITVRAPLTTDDDDERRTIQDGRQPIIALVYGRSKYAFPPVGGYRPRGVAPAPLARGRRVAVHSSGRPRGAE